MAQKTYTLNDMDTFEAAFPHHLDKAIDMEKDVDLIIAQFDSVSRRCRTLVRVNEELTYVELFSSDGEILHRPEVAVIDQESAVWLVLQIVGGSSVGVEAIMEIFR